MSAPVGGPSDRWRGAMRAAAFAAMAIALPALYLILTGNNVGRAAYDATAYHLRFIRELAEAFPNFDLSNPLTATTPAYHIVLATVAKAGASSLEALRIASMLIGCAFAALVAGWCALRVGARGAMLLVLPLVCSIYVVGSAAWTVPDNAAWICVAGILFLALRQPLRTRDIAMASVLLVLLVCTRQIHIWAASVIWIAAWQRAREGDPARSIIGAAIASIPAVLATLPAFLVLVLFMRHWGGLTPPRFQHDLVGVNLATPAFVLLQVAVLAIGFLPWFGGAIRDAWRTHRRWLIAAAVVALVLAVAPETTAKFEKGRFSGWWGLIERMPVIAGRTSVVMLLAAPIGAVVLTGAMLGIPKRARVILSVALLAFVAALTSNYNCWQRYHEPFLLVLMAVIASLQVARRDDAAARRAQLVAAIVLAVILGTATVLGLRGEPWPADAMPDKAHIAPGEVFAAPANNAPHSAQ